MTLIQNRSDSAIEQIIKGKLTNHGIPSLHESHKGVCRKLVSSYHTKRVPWWLMFILTREETLGISKPDTPNNNI